MLRASVLASMLCLLAAPMAAAKIYVAGVDASRWEVAPSSLECRLSHEIPVFGRAVFVSRAGFPVSFHLDAWNNPLKEGKAALSVVGPAWSPHDGTDLGQVPVRSGAHPVALESTLAARLLSELRRGRNPVFTRKAWYAGEEEVQVALSAVNFQPVYREYMACMAALVPASFEQIHRSVLLYGSDRWRLSDQSRERLDLIVRYIKADASVARVYVDGHSDSYGRRIHNRKLSKQRAKVTAAYLISQGVAPEMITTRYHGERFPVADNRSKAGRDRNRRVTVRLERADPAAALASQSSSEDQDSGVALPEEP